MLDAAGKANIKTKGKRIQSKRGLIEKESKTKVFRFQKRNMRMMMFLAEAVKDKRHTIEGILDGDSEHDKNRKRSSRMFEIMRKTKAFEREEIPRCQKKKQLMYLSKNIK